MSPTTLQPVTPERARYIDDRLRRVQDDDATALALDDHGNALDIVAVNDPSARHVLGDLDVHA